MEEENKNIETTNPDMDILDDMVKELAPAETPAETPTEAPAEETPTTLSDGSIHAGKPVEDKSIWDAMRQAKEERIAEIPPEEEVNPNIIPNDIPGVVPTPVGHVKKKKGIQPIHMLIVFILLIAIGLGVFIYYSMNYESDGYNTAEQYQTTTTKAE